MYIIIFVRVLLPWLSQNCGSLFLLQFLTDCILFLIPVFEMLQELIEK